MDVGEKTDHKKTFKKQYMEYIKDVQKKPNADFACPGIFRRSENTGSKALITLLLK